MNKESNFLINTLYSMACVALAVAILFCIPVIYFLSVPSRKKKQQVTTEIESSVQEDFEVSFAYRQDLVRYVFSVNKHVIYMSGVPDLDDENNNLTEGVQTFLVPKNELLAMCNHGSVIINKIELNALKPA